MDRMDLETIKECEQLSMNDVAFPEVIKRLAAAGIERYFVDLSGLRKLFFNKSGESLILTFDFSGPAIAELFDAQSVAASVKDIQQKNISYKDFLRRIMAAGCSHYEVFISGRKVLYFGRDGNHHIELFPGQKP